ncbi:ATP-binding protein [Desulfurivibrio sp. D14AmB]|uniref:sensor histidine kinase n=1 Tax=Desulfurivibrio sp. D14AmB TaxID=3374370 RepID=UPI00376F1C33
MNDGSRGDSLTGTRPELLARLAAGFALAVIGLGALALGGWLMELPRLTSFGAGKIPMAPSTALFFTLYGGGVLAANSERPSPQRSRAVALLAGALGAAALLLLLSALGGTYWVVEHLGLEIAGLFNGVPLGHMSPLTAFSFLLAGFALLALAAGERGRWWPLRPLLGLGCASLLSLLGFALLLAYLIGAPLLQGSGQVPPALPTSLAFFLLATALQLLAARRLWRSGSWAGGGASPLHYALVLIFLVLIGGIVTAGFVSVRHHEKEHLAAIAQQLNAVAALKVERIAAWLREARIQGLELAANQGFAARVEQWLGHGSQVDREIVLARLASQFATHDYDGLLLVDAQRRILHGLGDCLELDQTILTTIARAQRRNQVERSDLYRCPSGKIRLVWVVPIRSPEDGRPLAFLIRLVEARRFLFPFLAAWPGTSQSGETLLVRREGDGVLFLSPHGEDPDAALKLRLSLARREMPAVQAVLGREGLVEGRNHRGVAEIAVLLAVPDSEWFLVTRLDTAEAYAPLRERLWMLLLVVLLLLLGAAAGVFLLWRRQRRAHGFALLALAVARDQQMKLELEEQVAERTAQLAELNRELEAFSYSVSHDLKAPLRGIEGYCRLLERDYAARLDDEGRAFIANICRGVEQMRELINALLAYSRLERRQMGLKSVALLDLVQRVVAGCREEMAAAGVQLAVAVPDLKVWVDSDGLEMALRNLVDNAIKFSRGAAPPRITIAGELREGSLLLSVRDNGIGFEMKFADRIFEIFTRLEAGADRPGTGVGLALVRKAVRRMGGRVWAESTPGRGAVFLLEIPQKLGLAGGGAAGENDD